MKKAIIAVFLMVMQTTPPIPRKATDNPTAASSSVKHQSQNAQNRTARFVPGSQQMESISQDRDAGEQGSKNTEHNVTISKLPPVTVNRASRDLADWAYWAFSALLAVVGGLQVWLLMGTLQIVKRQVGFMERQTKATEDAAKAAQASADAANASVSAMHEANRINQGALEAVNRPYVSFPMAAEGTRIFATNTANVDVYRFCLPVQNTGDTPAREVVIQVNVREQVGDLPIDFAYSDYGQKQNGYAFIPAKGQVWSLDLDVRIDVLRRVHDGEKRLYFYGWATYRDMLGPKTPKYRTEFCHEMRVWFDDAEVKWRLRLYGNHNSQT